MGFKSLEEKVTNAVPVIHRTLLSTRQYVLSKIRSEFESINFGRVRGRAVNGKFSN